jgi:Domain of unknown function (DUF4136)
MRSQKVFVMLGLAMLVAAGARADKVSADYDHRVNFSKYKTFMWVREPEPKDPFLKERIMRSVDIELRARGLRPAAEGADLAVGANFVTEEKHSWETYYSGPGWGPGWGWGWGPGWGWGYGWGDGWAETTERTYEVGTLTVELFDANSRKAVWQGVGTDTVSSKPQKRTKEVEKQIAKMFRKFPPGAGD